MLLKIRAVKELDNISIYFRDKDFFFRTRKFCVYSYVEGQEFKEEILK